jgi:putative DNA primase/helicase
MIKETLEVMAPIAKNVPEELTERWQWVLWRLEERDGKLTKVPYQPNHHRASASDLMTWSTFEGALSVFEISRNLDIESRFEPFHGIGFMLSSADPFCGIDLDKCRNSETGDIAPWALEILDRVRDGYVEISPSGTGIHVIIRGDVRGGGIRRGPVEMYSRGRYFTITGLPL